MNPYDFIRMEWWRNKNEEGLGHAHVGFCKNGDIYLTFDVRKEGDNFISVFSPICKVGSSNGHTKKAYDFYRQQFYKLEGYDIQALTECNYRDLHNITKLYNFEL